MNFAEAVGLVIPSKFIEEKGGLCYLSWATLVGLSGRAAQQVVTFDERPVLRVFDGVVVAVDMRVGEKLQRTWLPVLDNRNTAIPVAKVDTRDISDTINRCRAKAIAMVTGHGLSMYAGYKGNGKKFLTELGVTPDCDPSQVAALVSKKGNAEYLDWASALAAARVVDPTFIWEVMDFPVKAETGVDPDLRQLTLALAGGYLVGIKVTYKGETHVEYLPIMDGSFKPLAKPTVADWNRTIMRALTKAIAVSTGYGLSVYAKESLLTPATSSVAAVDAAKENLGALVPAADKQQAVQSELPVRTTPAPVKEVAAIVAEAEVADIAGVSKVARDLVGQIMETVKAALSAKRIQDARNYLAGSKLTDVEKAYGNEALDALAKTLPESIATEAASVSDEARELVTQVVNTVKAALSAKRILDARNYLAGSKLTVAEKAYGNEMLDNLANSLIEEKAA